VLCHLPPARRLAHRRTIFDLNNVPGGQLKAAITGGTDGYSKARGEVNNIFKPGNVTIFEIDLT